MKKKLIKRTKPDGTVYYIVHLGDNYIRVFTESDYDNALALYESKPQEETDEILMEEEI